MTEWIECTLEDLGMIVGGATPSTKEPLNYEGGDIPWITPKDLSILDGRYISRGERNIALRGLNSCSSQMIPANSILFSSRAPIGYVAIANCSLCTNQGFKSIVPNQDTDYLFLYYLLKYNKDKIENLGSGTTFKEVSGSTMRKIKVNVPKSIKTQRAIGKILDAIDNKIEENSSINNNLQQQALTIYRELSKGESTHCLGDLIVEMPKSKIKVGDAKEAKGEYPFFTSGKSVLSYPTALVKGRNIYLNTGGNADVKYYIGDAAYSTDTWCIESKVVSTDYLYLALVDLLPEIEQTCFEGSALRHLQKGKIKSLPVSIPSTDESYSLFSALSVLFEHQSRNTQENKHLVALRDSLLPKLMSGEIDVSKVEI